MNFYTQAKEILEHRASTKVKMKQVLVLLEEMFMVAEENNLQVFDFENKQECQEILHELYSDFHYSYPTCDVVDAHVHILANLKVQLQDEKEAIFFPFCACLQGYAMNHDQERIESLKGFLLKHYPQQPLATYHAIFSGLKVKPEQSLLEIYYKEVLGYEPNTDEEIKHLESIHEIYEALIWKKR